MKKIIQERSIDILCILIFGCMSIFLLYNKSYISTLGGDVGDGAYSLFAGIAKVIHNGELPLWNPTMWGGMTGIGNPAAQVFYPITYLLCKICYNEEIGMLSYSIISYSAVIHIFILAAGFYILFRIMEFYPITAFSIASLAAFSGSGFHMRGWPYIYSGLVYIPLFIGLIIGMMNREGKKSLIYGVFAGAVLGVSGLAATSHGVLFLILTFAIVYFVYMWSFRQNWKKMIWGTSRCFIVGGIGIGIMSPALLPLIEFLGDSYRFIEGSDAVNKSEKMSFESFIQFSIDFGQIRDIIGGYYGWIAIGSVLIFFVILGFFCKVEKNKEVFWSGINIFLFGILYASALYLPNIMYYIPFYNNIREPFLYSFLFVVGVAIIGAFGLNTILDMRSDETFSSRFYNPLGIVICFIIVVFNLFFPHKYSVISLGVVGGILILLVIWRFVQRRLYVTVATFLLIMLVGTEFYQFQSKLDQMGKYTIDEAVSSVSSTNLNILRLLDEDDLPSDKDAYRIIQWTRKGRAYPDNIWSVWGYNNALAYMNPSHSDAMNIHLNWSLDKRLFLSNIRYLVCTSKEKKDFLNYIKELGLKEVKRVDGILPEYDSTEAVEDIVYENENRMGNAWFVENWSGYSAEDDISELNDRINDPNFQPRETALVNIDTSETPLKEKYASPEDSMIEMTKYNANSVYFHVEAAEDALMVTSEMMTPGWKVYIDGNRADILEVNTTFRGCIVPQGEHTVEYRYLPETFVIGCVLAAISILIIFIILIVVFCRKEK